MLRIKPDLTETQYELLQLMADNPRGHHCKTAEGDKDMCALGMMLLAHDIYQMADGHFIGSISRHGREALAAR